MRMYRKIEEDNNTVVYEYLWSDYEKPYTGLVEVNKKDLSYKVLKVADDDPRPEYAGVYAITTLARNNYPKTYTHTAS